jgi:hypothetical protein
VPAGDERAQPAPAFSDQIAIQNVAERHAVLGRQVGKQKLGDLTSDHAPVLGLLEQFQSDSCDSALLGMVQVVLIQYAF